jgi:hypothetical protein
MSKTMPEKSRLGENAIAAYESSLLKEAGLKRHEGAVREITGFLKKFGISLYVNANPFRIDDLIFYASPLEDVDGLFGYELSAARQCNNCKQYVVLNIENSTDPERFGQWLLEPHLCEFYSEERKTIKGFSDRADG